ncbi:hypothetical protein V6M85_01785 [Sulfolobus tengchongensis]|uniref:Uncharacterized protein n=1 Tax=Sulfolobus tengchongensis TaxID=207809 RepID=A0AAX4L1M4_9CREN
MNQVHEILEDSLSSFLKLLLLGDLLNISIDEKDAERLLQASSNIALDLTRGIMRKRFGNDKIKKIDESLNNVYLTFESIDTTPELYRLLVKKLSDIAKKSDLELIWKDLEEFENYLLKFNKKEIEETELGSVLHTISEMKKALINYLASIKGDNSEAILIIKNDNFNLILGDKVYELKISGLSNSEKSSSDSLRLQKALELVLNEEEKIKRKMILGEVFSISKIKDKNGKIINAMISFADSKEILDLRKTSNITIRFLRKIDDLCLFISGNNLYAITPCNTEFELDTEYIYKGENKFEKLINFNS